MYVLLTPDVLRPLLLLLLGLLLVLLVLVLVGLGVSVRVLGHGRGQLLLADLAHAGVGGADAASQRTGEGRVHGAGEDAAARVVVGAHVDRLGLARLPLA